MRETAGMQTKGEPSHQSESLSSTPQPILVDESTPLLLLNASESSSKSKPQRPGLMRAATAMPTLTEPHPGSLPTPLLSRPCMNRSASASTTFFPRPQATGTASRPNRPSLLRRATDALSIALDPTAKPSSTDKNRPIPPSHWTNHAHRGALLRTWDNVQDTSTRTKCGRTITAQLVSTEKQMVEQFQELGTGDVALSREWIEYVLGICMRHPFCTSEKVGRARVLAASAGSRGNWGPF